MENNEAHEIKFTLNFKTVTVIAKAQMRLIDLIRENFDLTGTKEGCGIGECGACTIVFDGVAVNACLVLAGQVNNKEILTIEGLSELEIGMVLQKCFVEEGAVQCGYCTPGMLMSAYALLMHNPSPSKEDIRLALSGNLCRCTGYIPIINAVNKATRVLSNKI